MVCANVEVSVRYFLAHPSLCWYDGLFYFIVLTYTILGDVAAAVQHELGAIEISMATGMAPGNATPVVVTGVR